MEERNDALFAMLPDVPSDRALLMREHTSFHIGGPADALFPRSAQELVHILQTASSIGMTPLVLGNATNVLISDEGIEEPVIFIGSALSGIEKEEDGFVVSAGTLLSTLSREALRLGFSGLEWANGIPGSVGGAIAMNAGAYGGEIADVLREVTFIEKGIVRTQKVQKGDFSYRRSPFAAPNRIVTAAKLSLPTNDGHAEERMRDFMQRRITKQPLQYPSAGSVFKRPEGRYAGALIEQAKLKGVEIGGARVSELHAGFIINTGGATCADVLSLIRLIQDRVYENSGIHLEPELKFIGRGF